MPSNSWLGRFIDRCLTSSHNTLYTLTPYSPSIFLFLSWKSLVFKLMFLWNLVVYVLCVCVAFSLAVLFVLFFIFFIPICCLVWGLFFLCVCVFWWGFFWDMNNLNSSSVMRLCFALCSFAGIWLVWALALLITEMVIIALTLGSHSQEVNLSLKPITLDRVRIVSHMLNFIIHRITEP